LTHILLLGLLIAAAILIAKGPPTGDVATRVVVTGSDLLQLRAGFQRTWQRQPTPAELRGELERFVRQEILYREALARGYDRDDLVVRRAMQQKMELLAASQGSQEPPTEEQIEAFFALRRERYRLPAVVSFAQVYVNPDAHADAAEVANELRARLERDDPAPEALVEYGDSIMLPSYLRSQTEQDIRSTFGDDFASAVVELEPGSWQGPIRSGYGLHLVRVTELEPSRIPEWREVASRVVSDMEYEARNASKEQLYQEIAQNYQVVMDAEVRDLLESATE
jgi:hypothetical protein